MRAALLATAACLTALALASCGGSGSKNGRATLNLWVFQEPSGSFTDAAKRCSQASGGRYEIKFNALSNDADQQRQSLVRRLAAKDSSIDIAGMDVVWTAEFAGAGWIKPWPAAAYLLKARKRVYTLTPIRPRARERAQPIGGLVKPTSRESS